MEEIKANPNVIFHARQWETLKIKLKNTSPFDNNDSVSLGFLEDNTSYVNIPIYNIINNGVSNQPWPEETNLLTPYWVGSNIDSEVFVRLQNDTTYSVFWYVRKNGVSSTFHSQMTNTLSGQINLYQINF